MRGGDWKVAGGEGRVDLGTPAVTDHTSGLWGSALASRSPAELVVFFYLFSSFSPLIHHPEVGWDHRLTALDESELFSETRWAAVPFEPFLSASIHPSIPGPCQRWTAGFLMMTTQWFFCLPMRIPQRGFLLTRWEPSVLSNRFFTMGMRWYMTGRMAGLESSMQDES